MKGNTSSTWLSLMMLSITPTSTMSRDSFADSASVNAMFLLLG